MSPCGATTRDVHGDLVCDRPRGHEGSHGAAVCGLRLRWSAAPPLSPREREIVDRFESAPNPLMPLCGEPSCAVCPTQDDLDAHHERQWHAAGEVAYGLLGLRYPGGA